MVMMGAMINFGGSIAFLIFAIFLSKGKGAFLIAGYNTMPDHEKAQYNELHLCRFMSKMMFGLSFSMFLWAVSELLEVPLLLYIGLILFVCIIVFGLVYSNTGNRFKKE